MYISKLPKKGLEKFFLIEIYIGNVKLSLLRRQYIWSTLSVFKKSPEILAIIKRDFFELDCAHNDQQIW